MDQFDHASLCLSDFDYQSCQSWLYETIERLNLVSYVKHIISLLDSVIVQNHWSIRLPVVGYCYVRYSLSFSCLTFVKCYLELKD